MVGGEGRLWGTRVLPGGCPGHAHVQDRVQPAPGWDPGEGSLGKLLCGEGKGLLAVLSIGPQRPSQMSYSAYPPTDVLCGAPIPCTQGPRGSPIGLSLYNSTPQPAPSWAVRAGGRSPLSMGVERKGTPALTKVTGAHLLHHAICFVLHLALGADLGHCGEKPATVTAPCCSCLSPGPASQGHSGEPQQLLCSPSSCARLMQGSQSFSLAPPQGGDRA